MLSLSLAGPLTAQQQQRVPKFPIASSPISLKGDVRPHQFVSVLGRSAAWLGQETGEAEVWVHPLKLAGDFQLDFKIPDYADPIRGKDVARTVEIRPELTTITYSHATFTVKQHILAPVSEPGIVILLDVETFRTLEIIVSFKTVLQFAWPGAFGGQYAFWNVGQKAFVLSESLRQRNALIGSPWAAAASTHPAHAIPDAPNTFVIPVDTVRAKREFIPIAVAAGIAPRDSVTAEYTHLIDSAERLYDEKLEHPYTTARDYPGEHQDPQSELVDHPWSAGAQCSNRGQHDTAQQWSPGTASFRSRPDVALSRHIVPGARVSVYRTWIERCRAEIGRCNVRRNG